MLRSLPLPLALVFSSLLAAPAEPAPEPPKAPVPACVWKLAGETNTVYLAGSIHLLTKNDYPLPEPFERAFADSPKVWFEAPVGELDNPALALDLIRLGTFSEPGQSLKDALSPETYAALREALPKHGLEPMVAVMDQMRPGFLAVLLGQQEMLALGADPELGLDRHFAARCKTDGKDMGALETWDFQMQMLNRFSEEESDKMIRYTLESLGETKAVFEKIVAAWKSGDAAAIGGIMEESTKEFPGLRDALLIRRNRTWVSQIEKLLAGESNVMLIVGVGHLSGSGSVLELLRENGHEPEQLTALPAPAAEEPRPEPEPAALPCR